MKLDTFTNILAFEDLDTDEPHAEIYAKDTELIAIIRQTDSLDQPILEIWPRTNGKNWEIDLECFSKACESAYAKLRTFKEDQRKALRNQSAEEVNQNGRLELESILRNPELMVITNRKGGKDYFLPGGKGVRFSQDDKLETFLEPEQA